MNAVCVVISQHAAIVDMQFVRQQKGKIVSSNFAAGIQPNLFAKYPDASCTTKGGLVIRFLYETLPLSHRSNISQAMRKKHHLKRRTALPQAVSSSLSSTTSISSASGLTSMQSIPAIDSTASAMVEFSVGSVVTTNGSRCFG